MQDLTQELDLTHFNTSKADFSFRFRKPGQILEIFKVENQIRGELTNYIYHTFKNRVDTFMQKKTA